MFDFYIIRLNTDNLKSWKYSISFELDYFNYEVFFEIWRSFRL